MLLLVQLLLISLLTPLALFLAKRSQHSRLWFLYFLLPLLAIGLIILGHRSTALSFQPPISWAIHPYVAPLLMAAAIPLMLATLILRLPVRRSRIVVSVLMGIMLIYYVLFPLLLPLAARASLAATPSSVDDQNVCRQTHSYTCGPAAAVTCLTVLKIPAAEGPLAIDAGSAPAMGTDPALLTIAINHLTAPENIRCDYRLFRSLDNLSTPCIANLFTPKYGGHYVAVLAITRGNLLIADPLSGRSNWPRAEFLAQWSGAAHVFTRQKP